MTNPIGTALANWACMQKDDAANLFPMSIPDSAELETLRMTFGFEEGKRVAFEAYLNALAEADEAVEEGRSAAELERYAARVRERAFALDRFGICAKS